MFNVALALIFVKKNILLISKVSWIRKQPLHILTAGTAVYTSDQRFQVNLTELLFKFNFDYNFEIFVIHCPCSMERNSVDLLDLSAFYQRDFQF